MILDIVRTVDEKFRFQIIFDKAEVNIENIKHWLKSIVFFKPSKMKGRILNKLNSWRYNEKTLIEFIEKELADDLDLRIHLETNKNFITIVRSASRACIYCSIDKLSFDEKKNEICLEIDKFFRKHNGIVAYGCSGKDWFFQNLTDPEWLPIYGKSAKDLPLVKSKLNPNWIEIDTEVFPGHEHTPHELWFGSCWLMWFGKKYLELFSKEAFLNFNNCYENREMDNGSVKITLYESVWDYEEEINRERQRDFRQKLGIDLVAHKLMETPIILDNPNPSIELSIGEFEHGGVRLAKSFYNEHGDLVPKSRAAECRILEYNKDGKVIWSEAKKL